jgi:hypothetical protein
MRRRASRVMLVSTCRRLRSQLAPSHIRHTSWKPVLVWYDGGMIAALGLDYHTAAYTSSSRQLSFCVL